MTTDASSKTTGGAKRHGATALLSTLAAIAVVAGCATERSGPVDTPATDETTSSPALRSEASATENPARGAPAFADDTARQTGEGTGGSGLVLTDVRVAEAEGFSRIVLEFSGTGTPGWVVNYVDRAALDGSGDVVDVGAGAILDIYASGTTWPAPDYYSGPAQFTPRGGGDVDDVYVGGTFEGYTQVLAGIDGDRVPFRVLARRAPSRLIVDVVDGNAD